MLAECSVTVIPRTVAAIEMEPDPDTSPDNVIVWFPVRYVAVSNDQAFAAVLRNRPLVPASASMATRSGYDAVDILASKAACNPFVFAIERAASAMLVVMLVAPDPVTMPERVMVWLPVRYEPAGWMPASARVALTQAVPFQRRISPAELDEIVTLLKLSSVWL